MTSDFHIGTEALPHLTSAVQLGFIFGTLVFSFLAFADRFSPSLIFLLCAISGALFNFATTMTSNTFLSLVILRVLVGISLAGVYPVGMKIASDHFSDGLGKSLGWLVGALVLGTSLPHVLRVINMTPSWETVISITSLLSLSGGLSLFILIPDGPYRKVAAKLNIITALRSFSNQNLIRPALGYFGHMWELYTFWLLVPLIYSTYFSGHSPNQNGFLSFVTIAAGSLGCILAGRLSIQFGSAKVAKTALITSTICCLLAPLILAPSAGYATIFFLVIWGIAVAADSPLFSTLIAQNTSPEYRGSVLTIINCIGFSLTIFSIQLTHLVLNYIDLSIALALLAIGPIVGLAAMYIQLPKKAQV